jgi:hypothetical protein
VAAIWLVSRVLTTVIMLAFAAREPATYWAPAHPSYLRLAQFWDSGWFHTIATTGYPLRLPSGAGGQVLPNAWAFLPGYPALVSALGGVTGLPWSIASVVVATGCSCGAALVLDRLLVATLGRREPFAVVLFCVSPLSPVYQVAYAEPMAVLLLALLLLLLVRRRYVAMLPCIVLVGLTRPLAVPVALLLAVHLLIRLVRRRVEPVPGRALLACCAALAVGAATAVAWPLAAALATGTRSAYLDSELAWRGSDSLVPFLPWLDAAREVGGPVLGPAVLIAILLAVAALLAAPPVRRLGADLVTWCASYALYLLAVFPPQPSVFRLLLPLFPLAGAVGAVRSRPARVGLVIACLLGQAVWFGATWARWHVRGWSPP